MLRNREVRGIVLIFTVIGFISVSICFSLNIIAGFICSAAIFSIGAVFFRFTWSRYKKIAEMSDYVRKMAGAGVSYDIRDNDEGELSILKNDTYKLALRLYEQADVSMKEKASLNDALFDISHQLKTPLTSLTVMADLLERESLPAEKRREFISNLQAGLSRMEWLVQSLLKMAKLDAGTEILKSEEVCVYELTEHAVKYVLTLMDIKNQTLEVRIDESLRAICDMNWTAEALSNILKNAAEHTPEGGAITVNAGENPLCVWITVTDSGGGIDSEDLPHLFKRFYKGRKSGKDSIGIGLAMSLSVMRKQNGDVEVKTEKNKGSAFTMKLYKPGT